MHHNGVFFTPIVRHLLGKSAGDSMSERRRAMHRAEGFMVDNSKLWRVSMRPQDRVARTECKPTLSGFDIALKAHQVNGHFSADSLKLHLCDKYFWPGLDTDCRQECIKCPQCKGFGPAKLNALLQPIRRVRPFDLTAGDYVSLPKGKGGFKTLGVYIDTCSNFVWVSKIKTAGTRFTTLDSLRQICLDYATPRAFMTDGGSHFKNSAVDEFCTDNNVQHIVTPAYAPWVNGLVGALTICSLVDSNRSALRTWMRSQAKSTPTPYLGTGQNTSTKQSAQSTTASYLRSMHHPGKSYLACPFDRIPAWNHLRHHNHYPPRTSTHTLHYLMHFATIHIYAPSRKQTARNKYSIQKHSSRTSTSAT